jgi:L-amino acid N-acyltransferase YncA
MDELTIRPARADDLGAITEIYNEAVLTSVATFDTEPKSLDDRRAWFAAHGPCHPVLVAEREGAVLGWASLSRWSERPAYAETVEVSVYVAAPHRGRGVGRRLLEAVLDRGRRAGLHAVIAQIAAENAVSIHLHEAFGFERVGLLREVGRKFGRLLDVLIMEKVYPGEQ